MIFETCRVGPDQVLIFPKKHDKSKFFKKVENNTFFPKKVHILPLNCYLIGKQNSSIFIVTTPPPFFFPIRGNTTTRYFIMQMRFFLRYTKMRLSHASEETSAWSIEKACNNYCLFSEAFIQLVVAYFFMDHNISAVLGFCKLLFLVTPVFCLHVVKT